MADLKVGDLVRVLAPFDAGYPDGAEVQEIVTNDDGSTVFILNDGFGYDRQYLEKVE